MLAFKILDILIQIIIKCGTSYIVSYEADHLFLELNSKLKLGDQSEQSLQLGISNFNNVMISSVLMILAYQKGLNIQY